MGVSGRLVDAKLALKVGKVKGKSVITIITK
jgi:hypothetical protein